jgi:hypothetical protein
VVRLARQQVWRLGFSSVLAGFGLPVVALHYGPLALPRRGGAVGRAGRP